MKEKRNNFNVEGIKEKINSILKKITLFFKENIKKPYFIIGLSIVFFIIIGIIVVVTTSGTNTDDIVIPDTEYGFTLDCEEAKLVDTFTYNTRIFHTAKNGSKYALLKISLKNTSDEILYLSDDEFVCSINGVVQDNITYYAKDYDNLPVTIEPGKTGEGYLAYEVKSDTKEIDLTFNKKTIHIKVN